MIDLLVQTDMFSNEPNKMLEDDLFTKNLTYSELREIIHLSDNDNLFPEAFYPILSQYYQSFKGFIENENFILDKERLMQSVLSVLMDKLSNLGNRSLVKDLAEKKVSDCLKGKTPEERFSYYVNEILANKQYISSFYKKYEALYVLLCQIIENHFSFIKEVVQQTKVNLSGIQNLVKQEITGIVDLAGELGDSHHDGKSVLIIIFNDHQKVIYKPRSMDLEVRFNQFLKLINNQKNGLLNFKEVKAITQKNYGWMEFVEHDSCHDKSEIDYFYQNMGQLTALLYFLNGKDFHHENIIASRKFPVLIDLESLFHAEQTENSEVGSTAYEKIYHLFNNSVQSIGILPQCLKSSSYEEFISADIGGVSGEKNQISPIKSNVIFNKFRDDIYIGKEYGLIATQKNIPILHGYEIKASQYAEKLQEGFVNFYNWVLENKSWVLNQVEHNFGRAYNRYIIKPTFLYGQLLRISFNPEILASIENRNVLLHRVGINQETKHKKLLKSELKSLQKGDIPYFITNISDLNIYDHEDLLIENYFTETPLEKVLSKIKQSNVCDRDFQLRIIEQIFSAKTVDLKKDITKIEFQQKTFSGCQQEKWLELSKKIGDEILENAISIKNKQQLYATWLGVNFEGQQDEFWELDVVSNDLYLGNSGIALFLAYLSKVTGEEKYLVGAKAAVNLIKEELDMITQNSSELIGAFNGISGYFYTIGKIDQMMDGEYREYLISKLPILQTLIKSDKNFDVISGSSGCLLVLLSLYKNFEKCPQVQVQILESAQLCYKHIKENACSEERGIHWRQSSFDPLVGFAHSNSGVIYSLTKLYEMTQQPDILAVIQRALNYERQFYSEEKKGWYFSSKQDKISLGWCNGTPGILSSRLALVKIGYQDEFLAHEIDIAINEVKKSAFGNNVSLCHGDFGNLEILAYASEVLDDKELHKRCLNTVQHLYDCYLEKRWKTGVFKGTVSYNLMVGLAGCGYSLLQAYQEYSLPKILLLN